VNKQMFRQFSECVRASLETPPAAPATPATPSGTTLPPTPSSTTPPAAKPSQGLTIEPVQPVRLLPLIWRALWDWLSGLVRRLVGRPPSVPR
jgi:hypothetical protein